jgi:predicted TIM-barrel fold metal-dependent hydrolase
VTIDGDSENCKPSQIAAVALKFPEVPFIMDMGFRAPVRPPEIEFGNAMRELVKKCPNLHLGLTALTTCQPAYLMSTIWTGGPERVVFGSNAPSGIPLFAVKGLKWARLDPKTEALIFRKPRRLGWPEAPGRKTMIYCCESYLSLTGNPYLVGRPGGADELVRIFDEAGIQAAMTLISSADPATNETVWEAMKKHPARIFGMCLVSSRLERKPAVDEFRGRSRGASRPEAWRGVR